MSARLSAEERRSFRERGYLHLRGAAPAPFLDEVQRYLEQLVHDHIADWRAVGLIDDGFADLGFTTRLHAAWRAGGRPSGVAVQRFDRVLRERLDGRVDDRWLSALAADASGWVDPMPLDYSFVRAKFPDDVSTTTPWHQDSQCLGEVIESGFVTAWLPLVDVDRRNSCLEVAALPPGREMLPPVQSSRTAYVCMAPADVARLAGIRTVTMGRGDVLLLGPFTPHRTLENTTSETRWSIDVRYSTSIDAPVGLRADRELVRPGGRPPGRDTRLARRPL